MWKLCSPNRHFTVTDSTPGRVVYDNECYVLTEGRCIHFMYSDSGNYNTLEFYRQSTNTNILWFDRRTQHHVVPFYYADRIRITHGNITMVNMTCADAGVYNVFIAPGTVHTYTIYAPHSCTQYTVTAYGDNLTLLPFSTTVGDKYMTWIENNRTHVTRLFTICALNVTYDNTDVTFTDVHGDTKTIFILVESAQYRTSVVCNLIGTYRWYYQDVQVVASRFFSIYNNTISGYGGEKDYSCQLLPRQRIGVIYGVVIIGCTFGLVYIILRVYKNVLLLW